MLYNINRVFFVDAKEGFQVMDHKNYIAADRISELPDHLQQHILSSLSINEVVQSPILSKRWKHVWTAVHNLVWFYRPQEKSGYSEKVTGLLYFCGKISRKPS